MSASKDDDVSNTNGDQTNTSAAATLSEDERKRKSRISGTLFLSGIGMFSLTAGFSYAISLAKKKDPTMFNTGFIGSKAIPESGGALAIRALGIGTAYAVGGVGLLCFGVWKLMGVHSMDEFTAKLQSKMPKLPKSPEQGRSDFGTVRELVNYIIEEDEKKKSSENR